MSIAIARLGVLLMLVALCGCEPSWSSQFRPGTKLYEREGHRYFGKVVGYEAQHDFHNGTPPQAAVLIETAEGDKETQVWGACSTCASTFKVEAP